MTFQKLLEIIEIRKQKHRYCYTSLFLCNSSYTALAAAMLIAHGVVMFRKALKCALEVGGVPTAVFPEEEVNSGL